MGIKENNAFNEKKQKFESSYSKILEAISEYEKADNFGRERLGISEVDYIRLTRVSQLVKKVAPKRDFISDEQSKTSGSGFYAKRLSSIFQNLRKIFPQRSKKNNENEVKSFSNSYILAEDCITNLHELQIHDRLLKNLNQENTQDLEKLLDIPLTR